ncbi:decaprenyl-phosphate phosphoribosyltransferase [Paenibacillus sp.]|uniref:decaprenyl-phosphate phosphoribosyltransferase n=1 Tax=Paenibacillus sp. TaxID=58172 RepID=UPI0035677FEB
MTDSMLYQARNYRSFMETSKLLFMQLRPKQWTKNMLVFAAFTFSIDKMHPGAVIHSLTAFILFSFVSGCVYILNDYMDREADRQHPDKRHRPMASGRLNPQLAVAFGFVLFVCSMAAAVREHPLFALLLFIYFALNVAYSLALKQVVIIDIMIIAAGFVLRALGGGIVIQVHFTPWFLLCVFLLSLLLAIGKRRHEFMLLQNDKGTHRKVLDKYSETLLDQMTGIVTTATIISYSMFTFLSGRTIHLMWTIPFVIYGVFRYLYLIHVLGKGGKPEELLLQDTGIVTTVMTYGITVVFILKAFG